MQPMTGDEAVQQYAAKLAERSDESARQLCIEARVFLRFAGAAQIEAITLAHLDAYRAWLAGRAQRGATDRPISLASCANYLQQVRLFLSFCREQGWTALSREDVRARLTIKRPHTAQSYEVLSDAEIVQVLAGAADWRCQATLLLGIYAGLRISEIVHLRVEDIRHDAARGLYFFHVRRGKGNKDRIVFLSPDVHAQLLSCTGAREGAERLLDYQRDTVRIWIRSAVRQAGITRRITPHGLRNTYAYRLAKANVPLVAISKLLGHSNILTTQRYVEHLTASEIAQYAPSLVR